MCEAAGGARFIDELLFVLLFLYQGQAAAEGFDRDIAVYDGIVRQVHHADGTTSELVFDRKTTYAYQSCLGAAIRKGGAECHRISSMPCAAIGDKC